ncbi:MAG: S8 family serine peptidase [Clostridia bacterium]|nr:S8 family serine peptidase [Clostridia bacterium]
MYQDPMYQDPMFQEPMYQPPGKRGSKKRMLILIGAGILAVALIVLLVVLLSRGSGRTDPSGSPENSADKNMQEVFAGFGRQGEAGESGDNDSAAGDSHNPDNAGGWNGLASAGEAVRQGSRPQLEAYIQDIAPEDVAFTEGNVPYVKSSLLLTAAPGTSKRAVEQLLDGMGAKIVGYLEISGDYQVQFTAPKTYEELEQAMEALRGSEIIETASLRELFLLSEEINAQQGNAEEAANPSFYLSGDDWNGDGGQVKNPALPSGAAWWAEAVRLPDAWHIADTSDRRLESIRVGVFDVDDFDLLNPSELEFEDAHFSAGSADQRHGTLVSSLIAAKGNNGTGIRGASPNALLYGCSLTGYYHLEAIYWPDPNQNIINARVPQNANELAVNGTAFTDMFGHKYGIFTLLQDDVKVINMSFGLEQLIASAWYDGLGEQGAETYAQRKLRECSAEFESFLIRCEAYYPDFICVVATGNMNNDSFKLTNNTNGYSLEKNAAGEICPIKMHHEITPEYNPFLRIPTNSAAAKHILSVGAIDLEYWVETAANQTPYSSDGAFRYSESDFSVRYADLCAPGGTMTVHLSDGSTDTHQILCVGPNGRQEEVEGTSLSAPIVSGIAALVWGYQPNLSVEELKECLLYTPYTAAHSNYTNRPGLKLIDAVAAMQRADEICSASGKSVHSQAIQPAGYYTGYLYTGDDDVPSSIQVASDCVIRLYDEDWNPKFEYSQRTDISFSMRVPPGKYYVRAIQEDLVKEYIGECEIKENEITYEGLHLQDRPAAMYAFAVHQTTKSGAWYEAGSGVVSASLAGFGASLDFDYMVHVTDFDPENPLKMKATGYGSISEYGIGIDYQISRANGKTSYSYSMYGMPMSTSSLSFEPAFFDFDQIKEAHLTTVEEIDDYSFLVSLNGEQLSSLSFDVIDAFGSGSAKEAMTGEMEVCLNQDMSLDTITIAVYIGVSSDLQGNLSINDRAQPNGNSVTVAEAEYDLVYTFSDTELVWEPDEDSYDSSGDAAEMLEGILDGIMTYGW